MPLDGTTRLLVSRRRALRREAQRRAAVADPNAFVEYAISDERAAHLVQADIHRRLQDHLRQHPRAIVIMPREHGKTTQVVARVLWELGRDPTLRTKVLCATDELAKKRVSLLRRMLTHCAEVRKTFPTLLSGSETWQAHSFSVARDTLVVDPSVEAYGVTSSGTGGRCDLLICDDVCDATNSLFSPTRREEVKEQLRNVWWNLVHPQRGRIWIVGTPWHYADAVQELAAGDTFATLRLGIDDAYTPLWPQRWPCERLKARRAEIGPIAWARSFQCVPLASEDHVFRPEWFRFWAPGELPAEGVQHYIGVDPAFSKSASADDTGIVVLARCANAYYVVEAIRKHGASLHDLTATLDALAARYKPACIGIEAVQAQVYLAQAMKRGTQWPIRELKTSRDKQSRMVVLAVHFENGRVLLRANGGSMPHRSQQDLYDQLIQFPAAPHDDLCDALDFAVQAAQQSNVQLRIL